MPDYSKGKIYTIRCLTDDNLIYVGSTIQPLYKRWNEHKCRSKTDINKLLYSFIGDDWGNWYIELYELYPCNTKEELDRKEGEIIRLIGFLNVVVAGRTQKEYYKENKDDILVYHKTYHQINKEKINNYSKEWHNKNKEQQREYQREYRKNNKEKITCECGCAISKINLVTHRKTQNHINLISKVHN